MFRICRFGLLMKGLPRGMFDRIVSELGADKYSKGFRCWDQLVAMLYAQWAGATSLRDVVVGFNSQELHHYHLGTREVRRSTLADANSQRNVAVFARTAEALMGLAHRQLRQEGRELLYLLDSSSLTLSGPGFDAWTKGNRTRNTQGLKLHVLYEAREQIPCRHSITAPNVNDVAEGMKLPIEKDAIYVFDKGYYHYGWWADINARGARFVTRFKHNAGLTALESLPIAAEAVGTILEDQVVQFRHKNPGGHRNNYTQSLRRVVVARPDHPTPLVLATNDMDASALTIARRYKDRWQIELFFKWIKQHLKIKRFLGQSENAVHTQILTALIAYLLLALYKQANGLTQSLWSLLAEFRPTLFQRPETDAAVLARRRRQREADLAQQPEFCL